MSIRYLDLSGAVNFWTNIKNYILSKIPTKTSELTNDSGFLTQHQSLSNYVTLNSEQTITGVKTFASSPLIYNSDATGSVPQITFKNSKTTKGSTTETGAQLIYFTDKNDAPLSMIESRVVSNGCTTLSTVAYNFNDSQNVSSSVQLIKNPTTAYYAPGADNDISLGRASARWLGVYATNYYYGSDNTPFTTKFVTSDTTQTISGAKTFSSTITGNISGNASTATEFSANKDVTLTGDVTGTASSKAGWSVATTLANSGVTAGTYGPSADVTGSNNTTILVPEITVDAKGRVTAVTNRTYTSVNTDSDKKVYQYYKSDDNVYRLLFSNNSGNTATSNVGAVYSGLNNSFYVNPSTGALYATKLYSNGTEVLTSHPSITLSTNTTSTASPTHGGTFTCIDSVTQDTNGHITKVNTKTVTLPSDNNTDTLMTQNVSTTNATYPVLLCATADATANQGAKTGIFAKSVKVNPSTNVISASGFSGPLTGNVTGNVTGNCSGSSGSCTGNAATATQFSANTTVALTGDATGTSAGSKKGWSVPVTLANSGVTAGTYGPSEDVTGNNNTTISVPQITVDAKGRVTSVTNRTYTSVNTDTNTDTKVTQTVTTANSGYPVLLCATANATATETTTSRFSAGLTVNTRYSAINMTNKYDTANTKGVRNTSTYSNGYIIFRCYDASEMGTIRCESSKNGYQQTYMQAKSYIKNGAISPEGTATTCYITVRVRDNGSKTIYTDGSWENSLTPYANNTHSLGTSSLQWKNAYAVNFYENGTALSDKYAQVDNISANGIGTTRLLAYEPSSTGDRSNPAGTTKPGSALYDVRMSLEDAAGSSGIFASDYSGLFRVIIDKNRTQPGTWKVLHYISAGVPSASHSSFAIAMWVRIA